MADAQKTLTQRLLRQWESPPVWLLLFIAIAWVQSRAVPIWDAGRWGNWVGSCLAFAGILMMVASLRQFAAAKTTVIPRETATVLITDGVYKLSRNPIYLADALILGGLAVIWDVAAVFWVVPFVLVIQQRFILGEEAGLRAGFGVQFEDWAKKTRRWL